MGDGEDTDSEMMRIQQGKDAPASLAPDETDAHPERADSDPESAAGRNSAKAGAARYPQNQQDKVLSDNQRSDYSTEAEVLEKGDLPDKPPLASAGRSLLGR